MAMTDIFNLSFFIILGIMVLFVSLLVVYFEAKMRTQNHKMGTMLSLVSTLAEDMNNMKNGMNYLAQVNKEQQNVVEQDNTINGGLGNNIKLVKTDLIDVSDNEESEEEVEEEKTYNLNVIDDNEEDTYNIIEEIEELTNEDTIKIVNIKPEIELINVDIPIENVEKTNVTEMDMEMETETLEENIIPTMDDLKTISIHMDGQIDVETNNEENNEENNEMIDYKKLNLPKLRSIATEKGVEDSTKLKKQELIELLENTK